MAGNGERLVEQTRADGRPHSITLHGGTRRGNSFLLVWGIAPHVAATAARAELAAYTTTKKHQMQLDRSLGLLYSSDTGTLVATVYASTFHDL